MGISANTVFSCSKGGEENLMKFVEQLNYDWFQIKMREAQNPVLAFHSSLTIQTQFNLENYHNTKLKKKKKRHIFTQIKCDNHNLGIHQVPFQVERNTRFRGKDYFDAFKP